MSRSTNSREFAIDRQISTDDILQHFGAAFDLNEKPLRKANEHYYDTFDWRLYDQGYMLKRVGKYFYLSSTEGELLYKEAGVAGKHFFSWDLSEGPLRQKVESIADIRALIEVLFLKKSSLQVDFLNKDRKTVVRLFHEHGQAGNSGEGEVVSPALRFVGMRGYENDFCKALKIAEQQDFQEQAKGQNFFHRGLAAIGRQAGDYSSKFEISLEHDITIEQALSRVGFNLVETMDRVYPGVLQDIDSEFLHDFRVAMRRIRSFLSQLKKSFPAEKVAFFQTELKWLGSITGPVRDLDVYLLMKDEFKAMLPADLHPGLEEFFIDLERTRVEKLEEMKQGLNSQRYHDWNEKWKAFLQLNGDPAPQQEDEHLCRPLALKKIRKCFKRILKDGRRINQDSPDEELHRLRIQGKKLRYLIEFFRSFFDTEEIEYFRKQLKKLQNNLGEFNDISVQLEMLVRSRRDLPRSRRSITIAAAIGGLVTHLNLRHKEVRKEFGEVFAVFASDENIERFYSLLR